MSKNCINYDLRGRRISVTRQYLCIKMIPTKILIGHIRESVTGRLGTLRSQPVCSIEQAVFQHDRRLLYGFALIAYTLLLDGKATEMVSTVPSNIITGQHLIHYSINSPFPTGRFRPDC